MSDTKVTSYGEAIRLKPDDAIAYLNRGYVKRSLGWYAEAIDDFDAALRLNPGDIRIYYSRGLTKRELGRDWEARRDLETA